MASYNLGDDNLSVEELQKKKLRLEISDLDRQWYKRKDYLQILLPTTLAIFSLVYALVSGVFSTKYELLQLREKAVEFSIARFEDKKAQLLETNNNLIRQNKNLNDSLYSQVNLSNKLESELDAKQAVASILENQLVNLRTQRQDYTEEINRLQNDFETKKQLFSGELKNEYLSTSDLRNKLNEKNKEINDLNEQLQSAKYNISLFNRFPKFSAAEKEDLNLWINDEMYEYLHRKNDSLFKNIQQHRAEINIPIQQHQRWLDSLDAEIKIRKLGQKN